jgi:hypothetical protein
MSGPNKNDSRSRAKKWSPEEKKILVESVAAKSSILFGKHSVTVTEDRKQKEWENITSLVSIIYLKIPSFKTNVKLQLL